MYNQQNDIWNENLKELKEEIVFTFCHQHNADRVALALCSAGYYVNIKYSSLENEVFVYSIK